MPGIVTNDESLFRFLSVEDRPFIKEVARLLADSQYGLALPIFVLSTCIKARPQKQHSFAKTRTCSLPFVAFCCCYAHVLAHPSCGGAGGLHRRCSFTED